MKKALLILLMLNGLNCFSQNTGDPFLDNLLKLPDLPTVYDIGNGWLPNSGNYNGNAPISPSIQQQNAYLIQQAERDVQRRLYENQRFAHHLLKNGFATPSANKDSVGTGYFQHAFAEIDSMLNGMKELSVARSVFLVENAFYENRLDYSDYQNFIKRKTELCDRIIKDAGQNPNDNLAKNMAIFRLLTEKVPFANSGKEKTEYHLPPQYDYHDYQSKEYFDSHFITKLMVSNIGQCYSIPLYYLILAEAMDAEAYWAMSPKHGFVKIRDEKGNWYNLELTCKAILTDAHYASNSYIKSEALRNKIYLEPLAGREIVTYQLLNLARCYRKKYGLDDFYLQCVSTVPRYIPNSVDALKMEAGYYQNLLIAAAKLLNKQDLQSFGDLQPLADRILDQLEEYYGKIDGLGYEETPDVIYENWLQYVEKQKLASDKNRTVLLNEIR